ncbi:hypothetical protein EKO23_20800 [Nocardioides guangzhouensis]|uniref:DoxX family membrane protein n=2 Tax=Nocardioides guangzhouensis TaxID=2497878 RepID=A0A4Q4Z537_9ACTN|nr:hypothetical protein EKO23_20800 [Nocardioides guangzhouensis]
MRGEMHDIATITHVAPARQAFLMLWATFVVAPILFGVDKFAEVLTDNWAGYLAGWVNDLVPGTAQQAMYAVGVVEILAGVLVALAPRIGGYVVALWLAGIIVNLVSTGEYYDIALRDVGLLVAALALARLAATFHHREETT